MKSVLLSFALAIFADTSLFAQTPEFVEQAEYQRPVVRISDTRLPVSKFFFDAELYDKISDLEGGFRIYNSTSGQQVPFYVKVDNIPHVESTYSPEKTILLSFEAVGDDGYFVLENKDRKKVSKLIIDTPDRDFERKVRIECSQDKQNWTPLAQDLSFFNYTKQFDLEKKDFEFPETDAPYFRIIIEDFNKQIQVSPTTTAIATDNTKQITQKESTWQEDKLKIDRFRLFSKGNKITALEDKLVDCNLELKQRTENGTTTILLFESKNEPLKKIQIFSDTAAFSRPVKIFGITPDQPENCPLVDETLSKMQDSKLSAGNNTFDLPATRYPAYRIEIENLDDIPLSNITVKTQRQSHMVFFPQTSGDLILYYGGELSKPEFDIKTLLSQAGTATAAPADFELGEPTRNETYSPKIQWSKYLFTVTVVILICGVLLILWRGLKTLNTKEENQQNTSSGSQD